MRNATLRPTWKQTFVAPLSSRCLRLSALALFWGVFGACFFAGGNARAEGESIPVPPGMEKAAALYAEKCAVCHGAAGEGTADHSSPLTGDKSVIELTKIIDETMPEGEPEAISREEAEALAAYIYDAFYSPLAQERIRPATVEFSRLTVRQFENTVTDLLASFRGGAAKPTQNGLKAEYYNLRSFNKDKKVYERVDPVVDFDFGAEKPEGFPTEPDNEKRRPDDIHDQKEYSIRWNGSIFIPETGDYEFIVESENGYRLYVNGNRKPICDTWVSAGNEASQRATLRLLGGRRYPIRLEFFRYKQPTGGIHLRWKRPDHVEEVIPSRFLYVDWAPELFVLTTRFPPDDRSTGYERGNSISKGWKDAVVQASLEVADQVTDQLNQLAGIKEKDEEREKKIRAFCIRFVERALRRPLSEEDTEKFVDSVRRDVSEETGVRRVVLLTMLSPEFLYREHGWKRFDAYDTAAWLSFGMWDSIPDQQLLDAAKKNQLQTREQLEQQVRRMAQDPRAKQKLSEFFRQWFKLDHMPEIVKNPDAFPGFDARLVSDLRDSFELFLNDLLSSEEADFRRIFLDDDLYLNGRLAAYYGADLPADAEFQKVRFQPETRAGMLTHPLILSGFAYDIESSPIHRGVFIARSLLGRRIKSPPVAVAPLAPDLHADLTTRARVHLQTSPALCQSCHAMINPLGFSLEHFDAVGRYRQEEKNQPVDATGAYMNPAGEQIAFNGSQELADFLVNSPETHTAFTEQLFQFAIRQPVRAFGHDKLDQLTSRFAERNFNIHQLLQEIVVDSALKMREIETQIASAP
jgi:Cytochrome c